MKAALIQMAVVEDDKEATIAKALAMVDEAAGRGAAFLVLPEIWPVGFMSFSRYHAEAEGEDGPTLTALKEAAARLGVWLHTGSFVLSQAGRFYNSSYLLNPAGEVTANYRKVHLFGYESQEHRLLTPGQSPALAETPLGTTGLATCYDLRFPELFRRYVDLGAAAFAVCSAWPAARLPHWRIFTRARALENQAFLLAANSCGVNQGVPFAGHSVVVGPDGGVLDEAGEEETILFAEIDPAAVGRARDEFPALADRVAWLR